MITQVLLDMDGILCNWVQGVCDLLGKPNPYLEPKNAGVWDIEELLGTSVWGAIHATHGYFWADLPEMSDTPELLSLVRQYVPWESIGILTAGPLRGSTIDGKMEWIQRNYPLLKSRVLVGRDKSFCAGPHRLLIDDKKSNVDAFKTAGGQAILVPRPWNEDHKWHDVAIQKVREALEQL